MQGLVISERQALKHKSDNCYDLHFSQEESLPIFPSSGGIQGDMSPTKTPGSYPQAESGSICFRHCLSPGPNNIWICGYSLPRTPRNIWSQYHA